MHSIPSQCSHSTSLKTEASKLDVRHKTRVGRQSGSLIPTHHRSSDDKSEQQCDGYYQDDDHLVADAWRRWLRASTLAVEEAEDERQESREVSDNKEPDLNKDCV